MAIRKNLLQDHVPGHDPGILVLTRQVPLKVLPSVEPQSCFIGSTARPLGYFFTSVDVEKSSRAQSLAMPRHTGRIPGSYLRRVLRHSEIIRDFGALRIFCQVPCSADAMTHFAGSSIFLSGLMRQLNILVILYCRVHHRLT